MSGCRSRQDLTFQYPCSLRLPLPAGGTERARGLVPLAKRGGEPKGGGCKYKLCSSDWHKARLTREHPKNSAQFVKALAGILCQASYPKLG